MCRRVLYGPLSVVYPAASRNVDVDVDMRAGRLSPIIAAAPRSIDVDNRTAPPLLSRNVDVDMRVAPPLPSRGCRDAY